MKVVITGAGGLIGTQLARDLAHANEVLALTHRDLDITDGDAVNRRMIDARPQLVVNCAVIEVDECERDPRLAEAINVEGPRALAEISGRVGADFIHFSTNYVFDGRERGRDPYTIKDEPSPINVYGKTKAAGENAVRAASPRAYIIRTSWCYGPGKQTFLGKAPAELRAGREVRAIDDIWASTVYAGDLTTRVAEIVAAGRYGTYHAVNEGVCSYYEFAVEAGRLVGLSDAGIEELVEAVKEADAKRLAPRPRYTPMRCLLSDEIGLKPMRDWRSAMGDYVRTVSLGK